MYLAVFIRKSRIRKRRLSYIIKVLKELYSKKATPQEIKTTEGSPLLWKYFKWPYQAKVMKVFEATSSRVVLKKGAKSFINFEM